MGERLWITRDPDGVDYRIWLGDKRPVLINKTSKSWRTDSNTIMLHLLSSFDANKIEILPGACHELLMSCNHNPATPESMKEKVDTTKADLYVNKEPGLLERIKSLTNQATDEAFESIKKQVISQIEVLAKNENTHYQVDTHERSGVGRYADRLVQFFKSERFLVHKQTTPGTSQFVTLQIGWGDSLPNVERVED